MSTLSSQSRSAPRRATLSVEEWRYIYKLVLTEYHAPPHERHFQQPPEAALLVKLRKAMT